MQTFESLLTYRRDQIEVDISMNTLCNYKCPYCYARKEMKSEWLKMWSKKQCLDFLDSLSKSKYPVKLDILGGEPTMFPYLNFFLENAYKIPIIEEVQIFTNANVDLKRIKTDKKLSFLLAYHPTEIKNEELFINNIKYCLDNNFNCIVSVLLIQSEKYIDKINSFIKKIKPLNCIIEHKHIFTDNKGKVNFKFDVTGEDEEKRYKLNDKLLSVKDIELNDLNRFRGWKCELHHIDIEVDGSIQIGCKHSDYNIFKDTNFFERLDDDLLTVTCSENKCENYCWFDFFKYK